MGILKVNDMIPDFANFYTFKDRPRATAFSKVSATVGRGPVPRHAAIVTENVYHLWASDVFCHVWKIAGDRPPHYDKKMSFLSRLEDRGGQAPALRPATVGRGPVPRHATITVGRRPVPRHAAIVTENGRYLCALDVFYLV